jgi:glycogen operon protein
VPFPGTYSALGSDQLVERFLRHRVTTLQMLPVHWALRVHCNKTRYWGYDPLGYFAPEPTYSAYRDPQHQADELKSMVKRLHAARVEVIGDVVFNHTAEGNELGPTFSLRGLANNDYYRLGTSERGDGSYRGYVNLSGCGNTLNLENPVTLQLVLDCLRFWIAVYHFDGFRFDLASSLALVGNSFSQESPFLQAVAADPVLSEVKLIAEPWHWGWSCQGLFPSGWTELDGEYRLNVRRFWRGESGQVRVLADSLLGSRRIYPATNRPYASGKHITCHDGFTLRDAGEYESKHNEPNGENNEDGERNNCTFNHGFEGPSDDPFICQRRLQYYRNMLGTLFLSEGPIHVLATDVKLHTQEGNNNPHNQDNRTTWAEWNGEHFFECYEIFLSELRDRYPGIRLIKDEEAQLIWFNTSGASMNDDQWDDPDLCCLGMAFESEDRKTAQRCLLIALFNASQEKDETFLLPCRNEEGGRFFRLLDTAEDEPITECELEFGEYGLKAASLALIRFSPA